MSDSNKKFNFYINWLIIANVIALLVGLMTAFTPEIFLLKPHNNGTLSNFFEGNVELYNQYKNLKNWLLAIIGATIVGSQLLALCIIHIPLRKKEKWAYNILWISLLTWFCIDSFWSVYYNAAYNVWFINLPALIMISIPLLLIKKHLR